MYLLRKYLPDTVIFVFLVIIGIKISYLSENITDVDSFDESIYLHRGTTINPFIKHHLDGFFYYFWYNTLSIFTADNFGLFFLNNSILLILPGLVMFIILRVMKVNLLVAFISASAFLISSANISVIPFITKFALCVILSGLIIIYKIKDPIKKLLAAVFLSLILIYIRPEFILTLVVTSMLYIIGVSNNFKFNNRRNYFIRLLPVLSIILLITFFNPISRNRVNVAFTQHYAKDVLERNTNTTQGLEKITIPGEIMKQHFSTDHSISEAFLNNPKLFFEHIGYNLLRINERVDDALPYLVTHNENKTLKIFLYAVLIVLLFMGCYFLYIRVREKNFGTFSLIYFLFFLPPVVSALIFYPRVHYMIFNIAFILIYSCYELTIKIKNNQTIKKYSFSAAVILGILLTAFLPFRAGSESIHHTSCTILHTARELNNFNFKDTVNFFAVGPGIVTFLKNDWKYVSDDSFEKNFNNFIVEKNINLILVNKHFFSHPLIKIDPGIELLLNDTTFAKVNIPNCPSYLLVKKTNLK